MKPIRVLMVVRLFYPWIGGAERQAHKLATKLIERDVDVEIVTGWWFRGTPQREVIDGIHVFRNHTMWHMFDLKGLRKFGGYLYIGSLLWYLWRRRASYDIIHVHGLNYHTFTAVLAGRWFGRKTLAKLANSGPASDINKMRQNQQLPLAQYMLSTALKCDRLVAINAKIVDELLAVGVPADRIVRLTNGVEADPIPAKASYRLNDPVRLVYVGRLHQQKGLDVLLTAFSQLIERQPQLNLRLQLLGDGPLRDHLTNLAVELGVARQVDFVGQTDQVLEYLHQADIFVLPSRAEGVSNALLEAMSCGLPVVVSKIPGNVDVVEHDKDGLLFTVDDPHSLAENLNALLTQPDHRERLGQTARQTVEKRYSLDSLADRYVTLYQDLLSADGATSRSLVKERYVP